MPSSKRPVLGVVNVNRANANSADVGAVVRKQPSSSCVSSSVGKKATSKSSTATSSQPSSYTIISCLENIVHYANKRSPGGRGVLINDISTEYRKLYGQDLPSIQKTFEGHTSLSAVLRECCSQNVTVVNGRAVWVDDKEKDEEVPAKESNVEGKVANDNAVPLSTTARNSNNQEEPEDDDDIDDEDFDPIEDASIEDDDMTFVTADDFIDEAILFAEEEGDVEEEEDDTDDEDFDPIKDATIQKDDLNLKAADGFIDEAILFADEKDNNQDAAGDTDDEDFDPIKDSTVQKDDLNLKASDGFIDEAIIHAEEKVEQSDESSQMLSSPPAEEKQKDVATQKPPTREILLNRIESIVMLATIEEGGILLKDIAPQYCQEFGEGIPVKKCFGPTHNLRKVLTKWSPRVTIDADGKASWVENSESATPEEKQAATKIDDDSYNEDEDYDPSADSSATSVDMDLHNPDGFFDASTKALNKEMKALADDTPPQVPRDVLLNRIKCIVEEASADSSTGINMANIVPAYKNKYGDSLSAKESFGIKLKDVLIQFFPEVEIVGNNAVFVEPDEYKSEEDEDFDPITDSTVENGDMDLTVADGVVVDEAGLALQRIESIVEDAGPNGIQIPQIRAKYEKVYGPFSCRGTFKPCLSLKWVLMTKCGKKMEIIDGKSPKAIWRASASAAVESVIKDRTENKPSFSDVENSKEAEKATGEVVEEMPSSAVDSAEMKGAPEQVVENPYSSHKEDEEPEPICAMCIIM